MKKRLLALLISFTMMTNAFSAAFLAEDLTGTTETGYEQAPESDGLEADGMPEEEADPEEEALSELQADELTEGTELVDEQATELDNGSLIEDDSLVSASAEDNETPDAIEEDDLQSAAVPTLTGTCKVTLYGNGGTIDGKGATVITVDKGSRIYDRVTPEKEGYMFAGWGFRADSADVVWRYNVPFYFEEETATFYAVWKRKVNLRFDSNGGEFVGEGNVLTDYTYADEYILFEDPENGSLIVHDFRPEREGYIFEGWSLTPDAAECVLDKAHPKYKVSRDTTFYAQWTKGVVLTMDANGGEDTWYTENPGVYKPGETLDYFYFLDPTRDGYVFAGWGLAPDAASPVLSVDKPTYVIRKNTKLYALWTRACYVTWNANGGYFPDKWNEGTYSETLDLQSTLKDSRPDENPYRDGYVMKGWALTAGSATVLSDYTFTKNVTLYAVWEKGWKVTFKGNGGDVYDYYLHTIDDTAVRMIRKNASIQPRDTSGLNPNRYGYELVGWSLDTAGTKIVSGERDAMDLSSYALTGDVTLYAIWKSEAEKEKYTVTYDANGGCFYDLSEESKSSQYTYEIKPGDRAAFMEPEISPDHKVLGGWALEKGSTAAVLTEDVRYYPDGNVTLYAIWLPGYTATFDANGGTFGIWGDYEDEDYPNELTARVEYTQLAGGQVELSDDIYRSAAGKDLLGWSLTRNGEIVLSETKPYILNADTVFYAVWGSQDGTDGSSIQIAVTPNKLRLYVGETRQLDYTRDLQATPTWSVGNGSVVSVDRNGVVEALKAGKTYVTASAGNKFVTIQITVSAENHIRYFLNGGTNNAGNKETYSTATGMKLYNPTRKGMVFRGWYLEPTLVTKVTSIPKGGKGLIELYARWAYDIRKCTVTVADTTYNGKARTPAVTVMWGKTKLTLNKHYKVTYSNNVEPGTATVTVTAYRASYGTKTATFEIGKLKQTITVPAKIDRASKYTGKYVAITPKAHETSKFTYLSSDKTALPLKYISGKGEFAKLVKPGTYVIRVTTPETKHYLAGKAFIYVTLRNPQAFAKFTGLGAYNKTTASFNISGKADQWFSVKAYAKNGEPVIGYYITDAAGNAVTSDVAVIGKVSGKLQVKRSGTFYITFVAAATKNCTLGAQDYDGCRKTVKVVAKVK